MTSVCSLETTLLVNYSITNCLLCLLSCLTCLTGENNAICYSCIRNCHEGHNTEFVRHDRYVNNHDREALCSCSMKLLILGIIVGSRYILLLECT